MKDGYRTAEPDVEARVKRAYQEGVRDARAADAAVAANIPKPPRKWMSEETRRFVRFSVRGFAWLAALVGLCAASSGILHALAPGAEPAGIVFGFIVFGIFLVSYVVAHHR